jgi:hypothetical protein
MRATGMKTSEGTLAPTLKDSPSGSAHREGPHHHFPGRPQWRALHARFNREALPRFGARHAGDGRITPATAAPPPVPR